MNSVSKHLYHRGPEALEPRLRENAATTLVRGDDSVYMVQDGVRARDQSHNTLFAKVGAVSHWTDGRFIGPSQVQRVA